MANDTQLSLFKSLKWILLFCLFGLSLWFSKDVLKKYQEKTTAFAKSEAENIVHAPTTTICFAPIAKMSILENYNVTLYNLITYESNSPLNNLTMSWNEFQRKFYFQLKRDFNIAYGDVADAKGVFINLCTDQTYV